MKTLTKYMTFFGTVFKIQCIFLMYTTSQFRLDVFQVLKRYIWLEATIRTVEIERYQLYKGCGRKFRGLVPEPPIQRDCGETMYLRWEPDFIMSRR